MDIKGAPFLVWHPNVYAEMLAAKLDKFGAEARFYFSPGIFFSTVDFP